MPCTDGGVPYPPSKEELLDRKVPAMLCAIWSTLNTSMRSTLMEHVNWEEAGVTKDEFNEWWALHSKVDMQRKARAERQRKQMEVKANALAKLTKEEREALGVIP